MRTSGWFFQYFSCIKISEDVKNVGKVGKYWILREGKIHSSYISRFSSKAPWAHGYGVIINASIAIIIIIIAEFSTGC